jgi:hypothetical protein
MLQKLAPTLLSAHSFSPEAANAKRTNLGYRTTTPQPIQTKRKQTKPIQTKPNPRIVQGIFAIISCVRSGEIEISPATGMPALPPPRFWVAAAAANSLLSLVKMLETRAYSGRAPKSRPQNPEPQSCICFTDPGRHELNRIYKHPNRVRHVSMCALPRVRPRDAASGRRHFHAGRLLAGRARLRGRVG